MYDERDEQVRSSKFCYEGGIVSFVEFLNKGKTPIHQPIFFEKAGDFPVEVAIQYTEGYTENVETFVNNINTRAHFMDQFRNGVHSAGFFNEFEIDSQKRIQLVKRPKRERRGITYYDGNDVEIGILINTTLLNHPKIFSYFCNKVDKETFMMLYYGNGEITPKQYRKIFWRNHADEYELSYLIEDILKERAYIAFKGFNWQPNATYVQRSLYHLFKEYYKGGKVTIHKKDKGYNKIRYELEDLKRKENRELKRLRKEDAEKILGYVFERRKERDRIKAAEERARDIITRDRLGFDEYSFKGETKYGEIKERK
jgi:hypothetical protein